MNQNDIAHIISTGVCIFVLLTVIIRQHLEIGRYQKAMHKLMLEWQAWSAAKLQDFPTARLMAGIAREQTTLPPISAGAKDENTKEPYTIKQSAE